MSEDWREAAAFELLGYEHLLWSGAVSHTRARAMVATIMGPSMYSGWGIRTVAEGQEAYNPLSYHNGSVWPHDNSIIAMGLAMYGFATEAERVLDGLYHASQYFRHRRLPELFCGMTRKANEFPVHYPVACSPQAWASAAFLLLLRATLGLVPDAPRQRLTIRNPRLPAWVTDVTLRRLRVGSSRLDLQFTRRGESVFAAVLGHSGPPLKVRIELGRRR
jgi:glycogen debranching enzyme